MSTRQAAHHAQSSVPSVCKQPAQNPGTGKKYSLCSPTPDPLLSRGVISSPDDTDIHFRAASERQGNSPLGTC